MSTKDIERLDTFSVSGIEKEVCRDIEQRQIQGIKKYGTTVANNPLSTLQWLRHAYEESLDHCIYLKRVIADMEALDTKFKIEFNKTVTIVKNGDSLLKPKQ